eukprot:COSAG02_NODE_17229_length_1020_cov_0.831705_1_plen_153_part_10
MRGLSASSFDRTCDRHPKSYGVIPRPHSQLAAAVGWKEAGLADSHRPSGRVGGSALDRRLHPPTATHTHVSTLQPSVKCSVCNENDRKQQTSIAIGRERNPATIIAAVIRFASRTNTPDTTLPDLCPGRGSQSAQVCLAPAQARQPPRISRRR